MAPRVIILGEGQVHLSTPAGASSADEIRREPPGGGLTSIMPLLTPRPDVAIVTGDGEGAFFRASLAMEHGVSKVVLRRGAVAERWLNDLAGRAEQLGSEVLLRGDDERGYQRLRPQRREGLLEVGAPDVEAWAAGIEAARGDAQRSGELGLDLDPAERAALASSPPLPVDTAVPKMPHRLEDVAFGARLKPVLYLVLPKSEADAVRASYDGAHMVTHETALQIESSTGRRDYAGEDVSVHAFISRDKTLAERASALWKEGSSRHVRELGRLMGYPDCCVTSFSALASRSNNAALVYVTATRSRVLGARLYTPLNIVVIRIVPFTPCTFGCELGHAWAEGVLKALPEATSAPARKALARPVLYLDEARAIVFDAPEPAGAEGLRFRRAYWVVGSHPANDPAMLHARRIWGGALAGSGVLRVTEEAFEIRSEGGEVRRLRRSSPRLGALLDFRS